METEVLVRKLKAAEDAQVSHFCMMLALEEQLSKSRQAYLDLRELVETSWRDEQRAWARAREEVKTCAAELDAAVMS